MTIIKKLMSKKRRILNLWIHLINLKKVQYKSTAKKRELMQDKGKDKDKDKYKDKDKDKDKNNYKKKGSNRSQLRIK